MIKYMFATVTLLLCIFAFVGMAFQLTPAWGGFLFAAFVAAFFTCIASDHSW